MLKRALVLLSISKSATAWWCDGHMLTMSVAATQLSNSTLTAANALIQLLSQDYILSPDITTSACWADDLKAMGVGQFSIWHYIDLPVIVPPIFFEIPAVGNTSNNPWAINQAMTTLTSKYSIDADKARQIRFLIHFVGDLHQPLHASTLFSNQFPPPQGDQGGNLYMIAGANQSELHAFWDSGAGLWQDDLVRPLNATGQAWLDAWTATITKAYPPSSFQPELQITDPFLWAVESNALAWSFVYTAPQAAEGPLPDSYVQQARTMAQARIALGGYRLAQLLTSALGP